MIRQLSRSGIHQLKRTIFRSASTSNFPDLSKFRTYTPEDGYVLKSIYEPISMPDLTIDDYVWKNVSKWQNKVAIVCGLTGRKYTYSKLRDHSAAVAIRLQKQFNLKQGDIISICLPNIPEYAIILLGAIEAGLVITTINPVYTSGEISRQLISSKPKMIFSLPDNHHTIETAIELSKQPLQIVTVRTSKSDSVPNGSINFSDLMSTKDVDFNSLDKYTRDVDDLCILPYSSGTTGLPKGVMLSHLNITSNCEMLDAKLPERRLLLPTTNDFQEVLPSILPFFHIYGLVVSLIAKLALGCKIVTLPKFETSSFLTTLTEHKGTYLNIVPPIILFLGNNENVKERHLEHVRIIMSGAAPLGASDIERVKLKAPHTEFLQGYGLSINMFATCHIILRFFSGMTETSPVTFISPLPNTNYGSIGYVTSGTEAKIAKLNDPNFIGCDVNEEGELLVRGSQVMLGYYNNKAATDDMIVKGNWLRTGDMAVYDSDGRFYLKDRLKELIKVKGFQVPPAELEEILRTHPKVEDAAVVGISNDAYGEVPRAFVVKKKEANLNEKELLAFVHEQIADYKRIRGGIQFVQSVPKNASGKILRRSLKELYC